MRISISGSYSTGKTTLAQGLFQEVSGRFGDGQVTLIEETARKVIASGFKLDRHGTLEAYLAYSSMQLEAERRATSEIVICDRSLADLLAYVRANADPNIPASFVSALEEIVRMESRYFDWYCYVPIEFTLVVDDVRPDDALYQLAVDESFRRVMCEFALPCKEARGTLPERIAQMVKWMGI